MKKLMALGMMVLFAGSVWADDPKIPEPKPSGWSFSELEKIPVQAGGRIKPLRSYAQDLVFSITGSASYHGWGSLELLLSFMVAAPAWQEVDLIQITRADVKTQVGLNPNQRRYSLKTLATQSSIDQYAAQLESQEKGKELSDRDKELRLVLERVGVFRAVVAGEAWPIVPMKGLPGNSWAPLAGFEPEGAMIRTHFKALLIAYRDGKKDAFDAAVGALTSELRPQIDPTEFQRAQVEWWYLKVHPFLWSWIAYALAALLWFFGAPGRLAWVARSAFGIGVLAHVLGFVARCFVASRPPVTNMYESVVWVALGVVVFGVWLVRKSGSKTVLGICSTVAALALIAADSAPSVMDPAIRPLVPVLRSNYWLTVHVLTITLSYAAFAIAFGISNFTLWHFSKDENGRRSTILELNQFSYRAIQIGVVLVAAGTILGGIWADYSWGRFWGWDPKEVWALIVLMTYIVLLHGRMTGWVGHFGFAVAGVLCFLSVLMAWYGVNFILGVGLHTYGFSTGGRGTVFSVVALELLYVLWAVIRRQRKQRVAT